MRALAKQATRAKVLAAARETITNCGYEDTTIRDIAKLAGMSTGAVFSSFDSKEELLIAVLEAEHEEEKAFMKDVAFSNNDPVQRIGSMLAANYSFWQQKLNLLSCRLSLARSNDAFGEFTDKVDCALTNAICAVLLEHGVVEAELKAQVLLAVHLRNLQVQTGFPWHVDPKMPIGQSVNLVLQS